ncbi:MAG: hypothetical protein LBE36_06355 [Flavobacteriaceae bacterium]|jgi:hypothetical protein|nr:hypothetical protein [Flavobacteriaceae bacterium]
MESVSISGNNAFGGFAVEDIDHCPNQDLGSGIKTRLYYAPVSFFKLIKLPNENLGYEQSVKIWDSDVVFQSNVSWSYIDVLVDENELKTSIDGGDFRQKETSTLNFFVLGFNKKNAGFIKKCKNEPMVFGIEDSEGAFWLLGNLRNRAVLTSAEGSTGKQYDENSGFSVTVSANSPLIAVVEVNNTLNSDDMDLPIESKINYTSLDIFWRKNEFKLMFKSGLGRLAESNEPYDPEAAYLVDINNPSDMLDSVKIFKLFVNLPDWDSIKNYDPELVFERYRPTKFREYKDEQLTIKSFRKSGFRRSFDSKKPSVFPVNAKESVVDFFPEQFFKLSGSKARTTGTQQYGDGFIETVNKAWQHFRIRIQITVNNKRIVSPPLAWFKAVFTTEGTERKISYKYE